MSTSYLTIAYLAAALGVGAYCLFLWRNQVGLNRREQQAEVLRNDS